MDKRHPKAGIYCLNCENVLIHASTHCNLCGQKVIKQRFHTNMVMQQVFETFTNIESGFWYSIKMLVLAPHKFLSDYLQGKTKQYTNVFRLVFLLTAINFFLTKTTGLMDNQLQMSLANQEESEVRDQVMKIMQQYMMYIIFLMIPFYAIVSKWLFKKSKMFYAEHLILNTIWLSGSTLLGFFTYALVPFLDKSSVLVFTAIALAITLGYFTFANKHFFNISWIKSIWKSILHILLGYVVFTITIGIVAIVAGIIYASIVK